MFFNIKNVGVHRRFRIICKIKNEYPLILLVSDDVVINIINDIKIDMYNTIHTGEKIPDGGVSGGVFNKLYHSRFIIL